MWKNFFLLFWHFAFASIDIDELTKEAFSEFKIALPFIKNHSDIYEELEDLNNQSFSSVADKISILEEKYIYSIEFMQFALYQKIKAAYYLKPDKFIEFIKIFQNNYGFVNKYIVNILKMNFWWYYDMISSIKKSEEAIKRCEEVYSTLASLNEKFPCLDDKIENAMSTLRSFKAYLPLNKIYFDLFHKPTLWISFLFNTLTFLDDEEYEYQDEGYFRLIEFLVNQDSEILYSDALKVFEEMKLKFPNSSLILKVKALLKASKIK